MKRKYIIPNIEVSRFMGEKVFLEGGGFGTQSQGTDLGALGAKKRGGSSFYDDDTEEESDSRFYKGLW